MNPAQNLTEKARSRVAAAQADLDRALVAGEPTEPARERLALANDDLRSIETEGEQAAARSQAERAAHLEAEAQRLVDEAGNRIECELAALAALAVPPVDLPLSLAVALLAARQKAAEREEEHQSHLARLAALQARLASLEADRRAIIERRSNGEHDPADGHRLALLDADCEGLAALIQRTAAEAPSENGATRELAGWRGQWDRAVTDARRAALLDLAHELEAQLMKVAALLAASGAVGSTAGRYCPSPALGNACARGIW